MTRKYLTGLTLLLTIVGLTAWQWAGARGLPDFADLSEKAAPAVVNISTNQRTAGRDFLPQGLEDNPNSDWFRRFFGEDNADPHSRPLGSGFIVSSDGYILTNVHVIAGASEIIVRLTDRRQLPARLVGQDENSDLALLKVEATGLPTLKPGNVKKLRVGEWVVAIGSPFGFEHSVTAGIVSAKHRSLSSEQYVPFLQTDVPINPGSSGGPLLNLRGEVIGVNAQIYSRTGGFMGVSFAIPIDVAMDVAQQLKSRGRVARGWLGVVVQEVTRELAESLGMSRPEGALISKLLPGSPALQSGLQLGDVILKYNTRPVNRSSDLPLLVGRSKAGEPVEIIFLRRGQTMRVKLKVAALPDPENRVAVEPVRIPALGGVPLGMSVTDTTTAQQRMNAMKYGGVMVTGLSPGPAHQAGIQEGDIIAQVDSKAVQNRQHFIQMLSRQGRGQKVPVLVYRRNTPLFLALHIPR